MCDTLCVVGADRAVFAKNSDRPVAEAQVVEAHARRPAGGTLRTQYLDLIDTGAHAVVGSRPTWLWGFEHGVNEHGVAIGNERVWTTDDARSAPPALIGMDLVRLALERATSADDALDVLTSLLERHGQGGSCEEAHDEPYFSSFLVVDPRRAWVIETSARTWVAQPADAGAAISNRLTLRTGWTRASADVERGADFDRWRDPTIPTGLADHRLDATRGALATGTATSPRDMAAVLRHHGTVSWGAPGSDPSAVEPLPAGVDAEWHGVTVCMHVRDYQATTGSMIAELTATAPPRLWICVGSPCVGVYVPVFGSAVPAELSDPNTWQRFARLRDRVERDATTDALVAVRAAFGPVEAELWEGADDAAATGDRGALDAFARSSFAPVADALARLGV
ncbi:MAG TPA: hypothetical protein VFZ83_00050 [Acidimicrobiia bacterium]|nr:hypothetical protein [Acidimicrobiia bacterium]